MKFNECSAQHNLDAKTVEFALIVSLYIDKNVTSYMKFNALAI